MKKHKIQEKAIEALGAGLAITVMSVFIYNALVEFLINLSAQKLDVATATITIILAVTTFDWFITKAIVGRKVI